MQLHFTGGLAVNLKYTLMLSREKFLRLRNLLGHRFDTKQSKWVRLTSDCGVPFPKLPGRTKLEQHVASIKSLFSLQVSKDGLNASTDLRFIMAKSILTSIQGGYYRVENSQVVNQFGETVRIQFLYDAANLMKGFLVTFLYCF